MESNLPKTNKAITGISKDGNRKKTNGIYTKTVQNVTDNQLKTVPAPTQDLAVPQDEVMLEKRKPEREQERGERKGRVFLKNLVFDVNEKMIRKLCNEFGDIIDLSIPIDPSNNRPRGFAFVEFSTKNMALKAVNKLNNLTWKGRKLSVSLAVDKRRLQSGQHDTNEVVKVGNSSGLDQVEETGGEIEFVKAESKPEKKKKAEKVPEELEDNELDELDKLVLKNIQEMGNDFSFDPEDEEDEIEDSQPIGSKPNEKKDSKVDQRELKLETRDPQNKGLSEKVDELLKKAELEKKKVGEKHRENEDLSRTCFVRGVSYDIREAELAKTLKTQIGEIEYIKLVKMKSGAEGKHNGNGFIKFKDPKLVARLIEMTKEFNQGDYVPQAKDPQLEVNGIRIQFFPALSKKDAKEIQLEREKEIINKDQKIEKNRTKKPKTLDGLIATDKAGKRRFAYAKMGFFELGEEIKLSDIEKQQRKNHLEEKLAKMQNPNYFVSDRRVLLKNIDKMMTDLQVKKLVTNLLANHLPANDLKKVKLFSDVRLLASRSEDSTGKSSVQFSNPGDCIH